MQRNKFLPLPKYCFAAAESGSKGLPDNVWPSPDSKTFKRVNKVQGKCEYITLEGMGVPSLKHLMKYFCA
jgi:hypothetical protein